MGNEGREGRQHPGFGGCPPQGRWKLQLLACFAAPAPFRSADWRREWARRLEGRERAGAAELLLERATAFVCLLHPRTTRGRLERGFSSGAVRGRAPVRPAPLVRAPGGRSRPRGGAALVLAVLSLGCAAPGGRRRVAGAGVCPLWGVQAIRSGVRDGMWSLRGCFLSPAPTLGSVDWTGAMDWGRERRGAVMTSVAGKWPGCRGSCCGLPLSPVSSFPLPRCPVRGPPGSHPPPWAQVKRRRRGACSGALAPSPVRGAGSLESDAEDSVILN